MIFIFRRTSLIMKNTRRKIIKGEKSSDPGNSIDFLFKWNHTQISNVKFVKSVHLNTHIKILHEGKRNYKCDSCGKLCATSGNLKSHIKIIHEKQRNHCDSCGKSFATLAYLNIHIKRVH